MKTTDSDLLDHINEFDVILFAMGITNSTNQGFANEIALNFPIVKKSENDTKYGDHHKYGTIHCTVVNGITFGACYIHNGGFAKKNGAFLNYKALEDCLIIANRNFKGKKIACRILGLDKTEGGGNRKKILDLFETLCKDLDLTLFDYQQKDNAKILYARARENYNRFKRKEITYDEYIAEKTQIEWEKKNGRLNPMPEDFKLPLKKKREKISVTKDMLTE